MKLTVVLWVSGCLGDASHGKRVPDGPHQIQPHHRPEATLGALKPNYLVWVYSLAPD